MDCDWSDGLDRHRMEGAMDGDKVGVSLEAKIIQELGCSRAAGLQIPGFVKYGMMARFYNTGGQVAVDDILVHHGISKEDASKVVMVELATMDT
jgi:hypothetical protein